MSLAQSGDKTLSPTTSTIGGLAGLAKVSAPKKVDLSTIEGLTSKAQELGYGKEANKIVDTTPKLSFLQRLGAGLSAFNPAEAILTGTEKGVGAGVIEYGKDIAKGVGSAITGTDYQTQRRYFSDVAEKMGITNGIAKFGVGFIGDVLLDPSTYFGGAIAKGLVKTASAGTNIALKTVGKIAPEVETGLKMAGTGIQDAFGRAFQAGYKSTVGAMGDVLGSMSKKSKAIAQSASDQLANLGVKGLTETQRLEVGLKTALGKQSEFLLGEQIGSRAEATKLINEAQTTGDFSKIESISPELSKKLNVKFDTPQQQEYFTIQQVRTKEFAKMADIQDPYSIYMPFLKKEVQDKFINDMIKSGIRVGSEGYKKEFKNILTTANIELDPAIAHHAVEAQIISDTVARETLQEFVSKYGKSLTEFTSEAEAKQAGLRLLKEKGGFGKPVGYVGEWDAKLFNDLIRPEFQTVNMLAKATGFDALTSLFKRGVTGLFLPFHVRNWMSGVIQNYEALGWKSLLPQNMNIGRKFAYYMGTGGKIPNGLKTITLAGKTMKFEDVYKPLYERFSGDTFYHEEFNTAIKAKQGLIKESKLLSKERIKETLKTGGLGQEAIPFKVGRVVGQFIEHQQKATAYITALSQGKTIPEALALAERAGFDYRVLTQFESQIMRRLIPFYSFTRKNIELQLKTLGESPERINQVLRFFGNIGENISEEEKKMLPDFIKESIGVKLQDSPEGLKQYISSFGTPIEAFTQLFGSNRILRAISMMNPLLKVPIELGIGKDSFRQKDIKEVYDAREYKMAPQILKDLLDLKEVQKDILTKNAQGKLIKTGERTEYQADPVKLLIARSLFTSRGVSYLDQLFGGDLKGFVKTIKVTTGFKPQQINLEVTQAVKEKEQKRALEDLLIKTGKVKIYQNAYEPKK